jgi:hypothetical protein
MNSSTDLVELEISKPEVMQPVYCENTIIVNPEISEGVQDKQLQVCIS